MSLIQVGLLLFVMMGFSTFVSDYGVLWLARGQAQNVADAAALAGATARMFDEPANPPAVNGAAAQSAQVAVAANKVLGVAPASVVRFEPDVTGPPTCLVAGARCVQVDVFRDNANGNPLPTYFANAFGKTSQNVRATATAQVITANATDCLRPFAVPDLWVDVTPGTADNAAGEYHHYKDSNPGKGTVLPNPDTYVKPTSTDPGTGYTIGNNYGTLITLKYPNGNNTPEQPGWYLAIDVPRADGAPSAGGARYDANIAGCNGIPIDIGDYLQTETGAKVGPTKDGIAALIAQDPDATWNSSTKTIDNTCAPGCGAYSPRVIALGVYNTEKYDYSRTHNDWSYCAGGGTCVQIVNFLAFFVAGIDNNGTVTGYLTREAGLLISGGGTNLNNQSSFMSVVQLVR